MFDVLPVQAEVILGYGGPDSDEPFQVSSLRTEVAYSLLSLSIYHFVYDFYSRLASHFLVTVSSWTFSHMAPAVVEVTTSHGAAFDEESF